MGTSSSSNSENSEDTGNGVIAKAGNMMSDPLAAVGLTKPSEQQPNGIATGGRRRRKNKHRNKSCKSGKPKRKSRGKR